jgi:hypothetical protein
MARRIVSRDGRGDARATPSRRTIMNARRTRAGHPLAPLALSLLSLACASTRASAPASDPPAGASVVTRATGTFEVKLVPRAADEDELDSAPNAGPNSGIGRMSIEKQFHGDLEGTSRGEMLAMSTAVQGSAGYVAIERVEGKLKGKSGTFSLQHSGTLSRGAPLLAISVVPDSGTGDLVGLAGSMTIQIAEGKHSYAFDYVLAPQR